MTTNLKSLAQTLGMSKTTVSRALNGYPEVNVRTGERVLAVAKELGYQANPMARSLALGRTNIFGIIHPLLPSELGDTCFLKTVGGMSAALEARDMSLSIAPVSPQNEMRTYDQMVRGRRVDGLIVGRTRVTDERIAFLAERKFPFIAHGRTRFDAAYAWFDYDDAAGIRLATGQLLQHGHQRIALVSAALELNFAAQRRDAFLKAMGEAGLAVDPRHLVADAHDRRAGYSAAQQLLATAPRPTAIVVDNQLSGIGVVRALLDAGVRLGEEMSVVVWGCLEDSLVGTQVACIDLPGVAEAGHKMVEMLFALRDGTPASELQELWQPSFVPGATIGPAVR